MSEKDILKKLYDGVLGGIMAAAAEAAQEALDANITPLKAIDEGMSPAIKEVGERFGRGEMFLPEMVASADAMEAALAVLEPHFEGDEGESKGKVLIATVQGDIHDIGKNIVVALLKVNGFDVVDIGRDIASTDIVDKSVDLGVEIIGLSGLLTTSLPMMRDIIEMLGDDGVRDQYKVIIGGGPTSQEYADEIGADGYGETAYSAVELCDQILSK